jgi:hypothetical protein
VMKEVRDFLYAFDEQISVLMGDLIITKRNSSRLIYRIFRAGHCSVMMVLL